MPASPSCASPTCCRSARRWASPSAASATSSTASCGAGPPRCPGGLVFPGAGDAQPRHPSQLYELVAEGPLLFVALALLVRWDGARPGYVAAAFLLGYASVRFVLEFLREPDAHMGLYAGLSAGQLLSLLMLVGGAAVLAAARRAS